MGACCSSNGRAEKRGHTKSAKEVGGITTQMQKLLKSAHDIVLDEVIISDFEHTHRLLLDVVTVHSLYKVRARQHLILSVEPPKRPITRPRP